MKRGSTNGTRPRLSLAEQLKKIDEKKKKLEIKQQIQTLREQLKTRK